MSTTKVDKSLVIDQVLIKKLEKFRKNVQLSQNIDGSYSVDLSYYKSAGNPRLEGQFENKGQNVQGSHTVSYALLLTALERRLNGRSLPDMLKQIDHRESTQPTLNNDLYTLFYIYSKIDGRSSNWYLMEKLKLVYDSTIKLFSGIYFLDEKRLEDFKTLFYDYLYNYLVCLQFIPFSATGEKNGGRGERIKYLDRVTDEREFIGYLTKLFDEEAIKQLLALHVAGKDTHMAQQAEVNIVAYLLMGFLFMLEGYPPAKKYFFQDSVRVSTAKLPNIATVIFSHWKKGKNRQFNDPLVTDKEQLDLVEKALWVIGKQRFMEYRYMFLSGFS